MHEIVMKLEKDRVYFDKVTFIPTSALGLDRSVSIFKPGTYWKVRIVRYFEEQKRLAVQIVNYHGSQIEFKNQSAFPFEVQSVSFLSLSTDYLLRCTERILIPELKPEPAPAPVVKEPPWSSYHKYKKEEKETAPIVEYTKREIQSSFKVTIDDLAFDRGEVYFTAFIKEIKRDMYVRLRHTSIRPEYLSVKDLLKRIIGKNAIDVTVDMEITEQPDGLIERARILRAKSPDVEKFVCEEIGLALENKRIDEYIAGLCETPLETRSEITAFNDIYKKFKTEMISSEKCLKKIFDRSKIHSSHLHYLSNRHVLDRFNLRIASRPFSFLFLLEGPLLYHFVLEVHSEELATYVWHVGKNPSKLREKFREIEPVIKSFEDSNRNRYLRTKPVDFSRIPHEYTEDRKGFERWKKRLEKVLT